MATIGQATFNQYVEITSEDPITPGESEISSSTPVKNVTVTGVHTTNYASLNLAVAAAGSNDTTILVNATTLLTADLTVPENVTLEKTRPGVINLGDYDLTHNGGMTGDMTSQWFNENGTGTVAGLRKTDGIRPEWFDAAGDYNTTTQTGTDDSASFQSAIDCIIRNKLSKLKLSQANYYIPTPVTITPLTGITAEMIIEGPAGSYSEDGLNFESCIYGQASQECIFNLGNSTTLKFWGIEFNGVKFCGTTGGADVVSAIKITSGYTGPFWPLIINRCYFNNFSTAAIYADNDSLTYNLAFLSVHRSTFKLNGYGVFLDETTIVNRCFGLTWEDNRCHQNVNGVIRGAFGGNIRIKGNNLEGQTNPINLTGTSVQVQASITGNYFEAVSGDYIINVHSSSPGVVDIGENYLTSTTATNPYIMSNVRGEVRDDIETTVTVGKGPIKVKNLVHVADYSGQIFSAYDILEKGLKDTLVTGILGYGATDGVQSTPFGPKAYDEKTSGSYQINTFNQAVTSGQTVNISILCKYSDAPSAVNSHMIIRDGAVTKKEIIGAIPATYDWVVMNFAWTADENITDLDFLFYPYGTAGSGDGCVVSASYIQILSDTNIQPYIPHTPAVETLSFTTSQTVRVGYSHTSIDNVGASGTVVATLPVSTPGQQYQFTRIASQSFRIDPSGTEVIQGGGAGKYLELDTDGDSVTLKCFVAGTWQIVAGYGTYAYEA